MSTLIISLQGCALVFQGHHLDPTEIASLQPGVTTEQDLLKLLGTPEAIVHKHSEGITIYQYKNVRAFSVGVPFLLTIGRTKQNGRVLNVVIKDGKVVDYEETDMIERFFSR